MTIAKTTPFSGKYPHRIHGSIKNRRQFGKEWQKKLYKKRKEELKLYGESKTRVAKFI